MNPSESLPPIIKESWRDNKSFEQDKIELVAVDWLWKYRGTNPSKMINLGDETVDLEGLWQKVLANGLTSPLIMRVGIKNKKFRLETGNHLIQVFKKYGVKEVPVIVQIREECGPDAPDPMTEATHNFDWGGEINLKGEPSEYMKPSNVFVSMK